MAVVRASDDRLKGALEQLAFRAAPVLVEHFRGVALLEEHLECPLGDVVFGGIVNWRRVVASSLLLHGGLLQPEGTSRG